MRRVKNGEVCVSPERAEARPDLKPTKLTSKRFSATAEKLISNLGIRAGAAPRRAPRKK